MDFILKPRDLVNGRFEVIIPLGSGNFTEFYRVKDIQTDSLLFLKIFKKGVGEFFEEYTDHLLLLQKTLDGISNPNLLSPIYTGETENYVFQVLPYDQSISMSLEDVIRIDAPLDPAKALDIVAKVSNALKEIHSKNIIHADIKPANILIADLPENEVYIIDFGMVQLIAPEDYILLVGTYKYMHPELKGHLKQMPKTSIGRVKLRGHVGTYIDIYALGVVTFQMLAGDSEIPHPLSEKRLATFLKEKNPVIELAESAVLDQLVNLLFQMLTIRHGDEDINAHTISLICKKLARNFQEIKITEKPIVAVHLEDKPVIEQSDTLGIREALQHLESIAESLAKSTTIMVRTAERLESDSSQKMDSSILAEMNESFTNAFARTKASWRIGVGMTIVCFLIIVGMITCAITLAFITGKLGWGLIFGGASVPMIIGTLLWRPYDRVFRATILAQQLEMIHIQSTSAFKSTSDLERRIEIFRESIERLQTLLEKHAIP